MCAIGGRRRVEELEHLRPDPYPAVAIDEGLQVGGHARQIVDCALFLVGPVALVVFRPYLTSMVRRVKNTMAPAPFLTAFLVSKYAFRQSVVIIISTVHITNRSKQHRTALVVRMYPLFAQETCKPTINTTAYAEGINK